MSFTERADGFQRRHRSAALPLGVIYKYFDDQGSYLAALITYYGFLSVFPLMLLLSTVLGIVLSGDPHAQQAVLGSALHQFPVIGAQLQHPGALGGGAAGIVIGGIGALYGGLGIAQALQHAMNSIWTVRRNERPNPFRARGRSVLLLLIGALGVGATTLLTAAVGGLGAFGVAARAFAVVAGVALNTVLFVTIFRIAVARDLSIRQVLPGAVMAGLLWQALQSFGALYVSHVIKGASATNGVFALVLGLIAFIYASAVVIVLCAQTNAVLVEHLYPRALLTPFTDDVELTEGDRRSYTGLAQAQAAKGFEDVEVSYRDPPSG